MGCDHNCATCKEKCSTPTNPLFETAKENNIKKIIGVVSGKGGVGKSTVTSLLAVELAKQGFKVGIMDSDITGPSIPKAFGLHDDVMGDGNLMWALESVKYGIKVMSVNLLISDPRLPVLWRGPMIGSAVRQFYSDVLWGDLDYLLIDMPPGTGDVAMTVFQSIPVDGVVIVTTPQDLVSMIVGKAVNMCNQMDVKILGLVENMAYMECPCCKEKLYPFGASKLEEVAKEYNLEPLQSMKIDPSINMLIDKGLVEDADSSIILDAVKKLI